MPQPAPRNVVNVMLNPRESWSRAHDLALVYVALAYGTDAKLTDKELSTVADALAAWRPDISADDVRDVIMEALAVLLDDDASDEVIAAIDRLHTALSLDERKQAMMDVMRIARADGVLLGRERTFIAHLANAWALKSEAAQMLAQSSPVAAQDNDWSLLHDLGLLYIVLAHSTDNKLSDSEIAAMLERMGQWQPEFDEQEIRAVLREALRIYSQSPGRDELVRSVSALKEALPFLQRVAVLDDLTYIAESDGSVNDYEREIISSMSQAFDVQVRLNGQLF